MPIEKNTHIVVDNSLVIYQRERTRVWQCKYLLKDKWYRCSTREHDMTAAIRSANMILMEAHMREPIITTSILFIFNQSTFTVNAKWAITYII